MLKSHSGGWTSVVGYKHFLTAVLLLEANFQLLGRGQLTGQVRQFGRMSSKLTDCPCLEWEIIDLALNAYSKVGVALYSTLGKDAVGAFLSYRPYYILILSLRVYVRNL